MNPIVVVAIAELLCTSLWFSANGAAAQLNAAWSIGVSELGWLTNAVQLGFILGTLVFAATGLADRFRASAIFFVSSWIGAFSNLGFALLSRGFEDALAFRFLVGVAMAGVYPLGMKIVISWTKGAAGQTLGLLVGMLTLGTALPHGLNAIGTDFDWRAPVLASSALAVVGGFCILRLGDGPHLPARSAGTAISLGAGFSAFRVPAFRSAAFGYFGHMWELYAFWALVPLLLPTSAKSDPATASALAFLIVAVGAAGCLLGGALSVRWGSRRIAVAALAISGLMCAIYPLAATASAELKLAILLVWGAAVVADSPQFSSLSAQACPGQTVGSALAVMNGIGFAVTVVAISVVSGQYDVLDEKVSWLLLAGPVAGLMGLVLVGRRRSVT